MKTLLSFCLMALLFCASTLNAQQQYTVDGQSYTLKTEIEGTLTLLWNTIDGEYRYFSKKGSDIVELKNTRTTGKYQEEYKEVLRQQTADASMNVDKVKLTLGGLKKFMIDYNKRKDPNYTVVSESIQLKTRLGIFGGVSNNIFTLNPDNTLLPVAGIDFEIIDDVRLRRHAVVVRFKQTFKNSDYNFSSSQFSINYRFKFVKTEKFDVFANVKFVTFSHIDREVVRTDPDTGVMTIESISGGDFQAPATFGLGADVALGKGYITFNYNDIFGLGVDSNGEFPADFTLGYKFNL